MEIIIERASVKDTDELMEAQNAAFKRDFLNYGECPSYITERGTMVEKINKAIFYKISLANCKIIGGIEIYPRNDFHYHLYMICVHPEYQNKGIGREAIEFMLSQHPEAVIWSLATPKDNPQTRHLYEKVGFVKSAEIASPGGVALVIYELLNKNAR
ncbi:MAG: GNAT family N-acetyltransferase [Armatimonadota bacterium]